MSKVAHKKQFKFEGELRRFQLVSNNIGFGPIPLPEDNEVEQHLTITSDGRVWLSRYRYGATGDRDKYELITKKFQKIDSAPIMKAFENYFQCGYEIFFATDVGSWELRLIDADGNIFKTHGSLSSTSNKN